MLFSRLAFACLLAATAAPLAAQDAKTPYDDAVAARMAGKPAVAVRLLEPWLAAHPDDVDARLQLGYAYLALGRLDAAEEAFRAVLAQAPDYRDASEGLAAVARRRAVPQTDRGFILLEGAADRVGGPASDWKEAAILLGVPLDDRAAITLGGNWYRRFGLQDTSINAGLTYHPNESLWLRAGGVATPNADFRPKAGLSAGIDYRLPGSAEATVLSFDARWENFPLQQVWTVSPGVTQYLANGRFSLTARANGVKAEGESLLFGGSLRADYLPAERTRGFVGIASGGDTSLGVVTNTFSAFAGGEFPLDRRFSLSGSIAREWRSGPADRTEFRLGLKARL